MRGHEQLKDIANILLKCLLLSLTTMTSSSSCGSDNHNSERTQYLVARSASDAFQILLSDSEVCLNKKFHANIKPLYKQRALLYRAFVHTISGIPMVALVAEMNKVIPLLLDALSVLDIDVLNKDLVYSLLLVLSGFLIDEKAHSGNSNPMFDCYNEFALHKDISHESAGHRWVCDLFVYEASSDVRSCSGRLLNWSQFPAGSPDKSGEGYIGVRTTMVHIGGENTNVLLRAPSSTCPAMKRVTRDY
ncbi:hypothetical protein HPP92_007804 [Vanilla planifolia]|uniref:MMS19 nucleotide excision repair protein n=1 Tax=Vanilla planifolia TaxID=51239 RepID=A0A835V925_VANPL|nr:hypothetical protein HPP92_007804 [Vanilla planifolia]